MTINTNNLTLEEYRRYTKHLESINENLLAEIEITRESCSNLYRAKTELSDVVSKLRAQIKELKVRQLLFYNIKTFKESVEFMLFQINQALNTQTIGTSDEEIEKLHKEITQLEGIIKEKDEEISVLKESRDELLKL